MPKTAVGLYASSELAVQAVHDLEAGGFRHEDLRVLSEPRYIAGGGLTGSPRHDFEVSLQRDVEAIGATEAEAQGYVDGVRSGGVLVFASGSDERVSLAIVIMNRGGTSAAETLDGGELHLPNSARRGMTSAQSRALRAAIHVRVV